MDTPALPTHILATKKLKHTQSRIDILRFFILHPRRAFTSKEIEQGTSDNLDRITLYRTLKTFLRKEIIHQTTNQEGQIKYALSISLVEKKSDDYHAHFHCRKCDKTYCIEEYKVTTSDPIASQIESTDFSVYGLCQKCSQ